MRTIRQPGPVAAERALAVPCSVEPVELHLKAGLTINDAIAQAHEMEGFSGCLDLSGVPLAPLDYVIPGEAPDADHVAWYSQTHSLDKATIERAGAIVGTRDGAPFLHCHGEWAGRMGHLLPLDSFVASDCVVTGLKMDGARFAVEENSETNFRLFAPKRTETTAKPDGFALVLRPNEPVLDAIEAVCARNSVERARIFGVGSTIGARFADGSEVASFATELLVTDGRYENGRCDLDIAIVGLDGVVRHGRLARDVAVLITFELVVHAV
ncbi:MAG: DUF296 domain-containing protein [Aliihoeflea sp.]